MLQKQYIIHSLRDKFNKLEIWLDIFLFNWHIVYTGELTKFVRKKKYCTTLRFKCITAFCATS